MALRPRYVVLGYDQNGRLELYGLYYHEGKAWRAYQRLQKPDENGLYTLLLEDGRREGIYGKDLRLTSRWLPVGPWTERRPERRSFFGVTDDEFREIALKQEVPESIVRSVAGWERDYAEDRGNVRWKAFVRTYLPRFLYRVIARGRGFAPVWDKSGELFQPSGASIGMQKIKNAWLWLIGRVWVIAAFVCLVLAIVLAVSDNVAAGTLLAALFVVLFVFHELPQIEYFKALGVEAKLRARLSEADDILTKLSQAARAQAQFLYLQFGWGSRIGGARQQQKQQIIDATDQVLQELGVSENEILAMKQDYLRFAALDQFNNLCRVVDIAVRSQKRANQARLSELSTNEDSSAYRKLKSDQDKLSELDGQHGNPLEDIVKGGQLNRFEDYCRQQVPVELLSEQDARILSSFADKTAASVKRCLASGRIDDEAAQLTDFHDAEDLYRQLFGIEPAT
jgi:hypothetical protein